ncbi:FadR/GntR family transcriptional regulator [Piscinibacter sakaiensis]|uniref:Transcriptional regulator, GntR family n=1 Tax=Piscinibacter sakaiensis TaxID=1547922 RepID=A0A0K8P3C9_PISS1|nr:FadR/GntR family transcriptional regulator [Piscinibacter sakaiensis]GAP37152.1 transcriptional regulator, GntR family [Piscinibacter sakaiensis]
MLDSPDLKLPKAAATPPALGGIMAYLRERRLQAGDRLPSERDFAERLGVSRNAVREALSTLVALRVVDSRPHAGIYLRHLGRESSFEALVMLAGLGEVPTATEVAETTEVRAHLEVLAVGLACERRDEADLQRLQDIVQHTEQVLADGGNIARHDTQFHLAVADATHNSVLVRVLNAFYEFTASRRALWFESQTEGAASAADHRQLLDCIARRDPAGAQALVRGHMRRASRYWGELLDAPPATPPRCPPPP